MLRPNQFWHFSRDKKMSVYKNPRYTVVRFEKSLWHALTFSKTLHAGHPVLCEMGTRDSGETKPPLNLNLNDSLFNEDYCPVAVSSQWYREHVHHQHTLPNIIFTTEQLDLMDACRTQLCWRYMLSLFPVVSDWRNSGITYYILHISLRIVLLFLFPRYRFTFTFKFLWIFHHFCIWLLVYIGIKQTHFIVTLLIYIHFTTFWLRSFVSFPWFLSGSSSHSNILISTYRLIAVVAIDALSLFRFYFERCTFFKWLCAFQIPEERQVESSLGYVSIPRARCHYQHSFRLIH